MSARLGWLLMCFGIVASAQQPPKNDSTPQLETLYMAVMKKAAGYDQARASKINPEHQRYWQQVAAAGTLILGGPVGDDSMEAVLVYRADSKQSATSVAASDPMIKSSLWNAQVHPWGTQKDFLKPLKNYDPAVVYYLGFLRRGDKWSPDATPERARIQEAHLKNIGRLHEMGKLVAAGPFMEDTDLRGIFVFKTTTAAEANELTNSDPAVQAGRLKIELHPWKLPAEAFPK